MIVEVALLAALNVPPLPRPGADKVKHFFVSAFVQSVSFSALRAAGADHRAAQAGAGAATMAVGVLKELRDRHAGGAFSGADLVWDAAGGLTAAALLNGTR